MVTLFYNDKKMAITFYSVNGPWRRNLNDFGGVSSSATMRLTHYYTLHTAIIKRAAVTL